MHCVFECGDYNFCARQNGVPACKPEGFIESNFNESVTEYRSTAPGKFFSNLHCTAAQSELCMILSAEVIVGPHNSTHVYFVTCPYANDGSAPSKSNVRRRPRPMRGNGGIVDCREDHLDECMYAEMRG